MKKETFIHRIQELAGIQERKRAEEATEAVLGTLCGRITREEAKDLASQLPDGIDSLCQGNLLKELVRRVEGPKRLERDAFVSAVADKIHLEDKTEAARVTTAVFRTLKEQISQGEAEDVASQLPQKLKVMWLES
ncbi:DUF2267 domain-containing protein [bacterium]|nr:DUF2267 domain-containing protein [bacterium]